jgi:hypothetical protein
LQFVQVRAAEEALKIRRHASWIAKQVAGFWKKAERVVNYKVKNINSSSNSGSGSRSSNSSISRGDHDVLVAAAG